MSVIIPSAIWSRADGDVKLFVPFNNDLPDDRSSFVNSYALTNATIIDGYLSVNSAGGANGVLQKITYGPSTPLGRSAGQAWTLEGFVKWFSSANSTQPAPFVDWLVGSQGYSFGAYANTGQVALNTADFGSPDAGPSGNVLVAGTVQHFAMVRPAGAGIHVVRCYLAGVQLFTFTEVADSLVGATGTLVIGKDVGASNAARYLVGGVTLTMREVYLGTSFTPPAPIAARNNLVITQQGVEEQVEESEEDWVVNTFPY